MVICELRLTVTRSPRLLPAQFITDMQIYQFLHRGSNEPAITHRIGMSLSASRRVPVASFSSVHRATPPADIAKALREDGCVVIKSMFTPSQISRLNKDMNTGLAKVTPGKAANPAAEPLPNGMDAEVFGSNTKRLGGLINHSKIWCEEFINDDVLHSVSAATLKPLGDYRLSTAQMIEIGPGSEAQPFHADGAGWWPFWSMGDAWNPEFCLNFLIATTQTTKVNGATGLVWESQKIKFGEMAHDPTCSLWRVSNEAVEQVELDAGDCLVLGGRMVHRGGANVTTDEFRRVLSCTVISSTLTPEEAHPLMLDKEISQTLPERVKKFLGFKGQKTALGPDVWQDYNG